MTLSDLVARTWRENRLFSALVELTYRCNLDCVFCYNDTGLAGRPMTLAAYEALFGELAEMGVFHLTLTGGEPLAHPHFFTLGRKARDLGFAVRVKSNGHALALPLATRLKNEVDPFVVEVSLHGATAATHERQTRVPGSFERLLANLDAMKSVGLRVKINSTLTRWNEGEIRPMFALAERLGLVLQMDPEVTPKDDGDESPLALSPTREGLLALYRFDEERAGGGSAPAEPCANETPAPPAPDTGGKHCGAGSNNVAIDPYGNVYPCVQWRVSVGNLHEESLASIFAKSPKLASLRDLNRQVKAEVDAHGPDASLMSFCPGVALGVSGSPLTVHPAALDRLALRRQARADAAGPVNPPLALPSLARP